MKLKREKLTRLEHGEVGGVDRQQVEVRRKARHETNQGLVDLGVSPTVPSGKDALLRGGQKELEIK